MYYRNNRESVEFSLKLCDMFRGPGGQHHRSDSNIQYLPYTDDDYQQFSIFANNANVIGGQDRSENWIQNKKKPENSNNKSTKPLTKLLALIQEVNTSTPKK